MSAATHRMFIAGKMCAASDGATFPSFNPATEEQWADIPAATAVDVDRAVMAARKAFDEGPWRRMPPAERGNRLRRLAELVPPHAEKLGRTETIDTGKLFRETRWQANNVARIYDFYGSLADKLNGDFIQTGMEENFMYVTHEPVGVVAAIVPWNTQIQLTANKIGPALAAGNSVVVKASEHASAAMLEFAAVMAELDLPEGVFNIVTGHGSPCGEALISHGQVDRVSFTGGVDTARKIVPATAGNLARLNLELGGKSPVVVFDDANIESALNGVMAGIFGASGQSCAAGSRLIIHERIHEDFVARLAERAQAILIGDPLEEATQMGPLATPAQLSRIEKLLDQSLDNGARLVTGGGRPDGQKKGWYFEPTIVDCEHQDFPVVRNELFGPVLSVLRFKDEAEAVALANDSEFAFAGGIFTRDISRALRLSREIRAGRLWINTYRRSTPKVPFGGFKNSGYGREAGINAMRDFTETKGVMIDTSGKPMADPFIMG